MQTRLMRGRISLLAMAVVAGCATSLPSNTDAGGQQSDLTSQGSPDAGDAGDMDAGADSGTTVLDGGPLDGGADAGPTDAGGTMDAGNTASNEPLCGLDGSSCFGSPVTDSDYFQTVSLATADFNQDGIDDVIKVGTEGYPFDGGAIIYFGTPDGGLVPGPIFLEGEPYNVRTGDLNGDGWPDFVVTGYGQIDVEINETDGGFWSTTIGDGGGRAGVPGAFHPSQTVFADIDGDGRTDLIVCAYEGVFVLFDDGGPPSFGAPVLLPAPAAFNGQIEACSEATVGDVNEDGLADVLTLVSGELVIRLGQGDGGFAVPSVSSSDCAAGVFGSMVLSDLDGDGFPDFVCGTQAGIAIALNNAGDLGPEKYFYLSLSLGGWPLDYVVVADLNGDGYPDVAAASGGPFYECSGGGGGAFTFWNWGDAGFVLGEQLTIGPQSINSITTWRPAGASLPSLIVGDGCDANISIFPNLYAVDGG
jgi:hypothetical protein